MRQWLFCFFAILSFVLFAHEAVATDVRVTKNPSVTLHGGIDAVAYALQAAGITLEGERLPALVSDVRMGSPSAYAGLVESDKLLSAKIDHNRLSVVFERGGKRYQFNVQTSPIDLAKGKPSLDLPSKALSASVAGLKIEQNKWKLVSGYDLAIVIDTSGSMAEPLKTLPLNKWQWCTRFVSTFATDINPFLKGRGITIVRYSDAYSIYPACSPAQVLSLFHSTDPEGRTNIGEPMQEVLNSYLSSKRERPLLIVVLTDGVPTDGPNVAEVIIAATKKMNSKSEVQMTFLEIGDGNEGTALLRYLDDFLVADGAKYDIVKVKAFSELKHLQLVDILAKILGSDDELQVGKTLQADIDKLKAEIDMESTREKGKYPARK